MTRIYVLITLHFLDKRELQTPHKERRWTDWDDNIQKSSVLDAITQMEPRAAMDNGAGVRKSPMNKLIATLEHYFSVNGLYPYSN